MAARHVLGPIAGREHHQGRSREFRAQPNLFGQHEAIHFRHHVVQKHHQERVPFLVQGMLHGPQGFLAALHNGRLQAPATKEFL